MVATVTRTIPRHSPTALYSFPRPIGTIFLSRLPLYADCRCLSQPAKPQAVGISKSPTAIFAPSPAWDRANGLEAAPMKENIYLILCVLGIALPYWQFLPWVAANGLNLRLFFQQLFANRIGVFFGMDVLVSAFALLFFVRFESSRMRIPGRWLPLMAVLTVGVSLALPLFLYLRELARAPASAQRPAPTAS